MFKNNFLTGFLLGLVFPVAMYGVLLLGLDVLERLDIIYRYQFAADFHTRTLSLVAIGCNIFWIQYFNRRKWDHSVRGIVLPTMIMCIIWFVMYYDVLF